MTAVGLAVVEEVSTRRFLDEVVKNGEFLAVELKVLSRKMKLREVRGQGLLLALELGCPIGTKVVDQALAKQLLINSPRPSALRFMPALNVSRSEIETMVGTLEEVIGSCLGQ
jgi:acetylornithine/N-succinyldiaminopimelate aminotransferase